MGLFTLKTPTKPTRGITFKGRLAARLLLVVYLFVHLFRWKKWQYPPPGFHDDPLYFTPKEVLFFGYKYYFRTLERAEKNSGLENYFLSQEFSFPEKPSGSTTITLCAGGDLMPYTWINKRATQNLWDETGDFFFGADIVFANLETPIFFGDQPTPTPEVMLNDMYFNGSAEQFEIYNGNNRYKGYDVLSIANNHMLDKGEEGLYDTIGLLENKGINAVGSGTAPDAQDSFCIIERGGIKIAFLAYTYSLNKLLPIPGKEYLTNYLPLNEPGVDINLIIGHAKQAKERGADLIICSLHCGCAYQAYPATQTVDLFHRVFEQAGVDVILGHHPHNPQPMEQYPFTDPFTGEEKMGFAAYSLGDFIAYDLNIFCRMPLLLKLDITKSDEGTFVSGLQVLPGYMAGKRVNGVYELQLLNMAKIAGEGFVHPFLDKALKKEAKTLHRFLKNHIAPKQHEKWVVK